MSTIENHSGVVISRGGNRLAIPIYTDEQLARFSIATLEQLKASHEGFGLTDTALRCLEFIEDKKLHEPSIKRRQKKTANDGTVVTPKTKRPKVHPKNSIAISSHFEYLGAPLHNIMWSWGAASRESGDIFLRVWQDDMECRDGEIIVQLTLHSKFMGRRNLGYLERIKHVEEIKNNNKGFAVVCVAKDIKASPRKILSYDKDKIYPILRIIDINGDQWAVLGTGKKISEQMKP